ncbi:MAG: VWA domain-containing protein [Myxococcales bacterium]|nr:VWA domain-containing protein [Myxococcales bacterium]
MALRALALLSLILVPTVARADLADARETACAVDVRLAGPIATVTETHDLTGAEAAPAEAVYRFELPTGAAIVDARVAVGAGPGAGAVAVSAEALATATPDAERLGLAPDRGLVRWLASSAEADVFEARVFPVTAAARARLTLTWSVAASYRHGRLQVIVPARGDDPALARCAVTVHAKAQAGVRRFASAFVNGVKVAPAGGRTQVANARALAIEVEPEWRSAAPVVAMRSQPIGAARALTSVAVYLPPRRALATFAPPRLLLVIDTTRSMGAEGRAAASALADALIAAAPAATPVEAIVFDRASRRALGAWIPARDARRRVREALAATAVGGGTDLADALNLAAATVGDEPARVVVITDAILSTRVTAADLLGAATMPARTATLDVLVPVVPGAPLPDRAVLAPLAAAFHGKVIALRTTEIAARAAALPRQLADDLPIRDLAVLVDDAPVTVALPDELAPGDGVVVHVSHAGAPARSVRLVGQRGPATITATATALPATLDALAAAAAGRGAVSRDTAALDPADLLTLARRTRAVTPGSALAMIDVGAPGGGARFELARTTGAFTRTPPPGAAALDAAEREPAAADAATAADDNLPDTTYKYLIKYQLWPAVRACYVDALRGHARFEGTLEVTLEIARGEVHDARFGGTTLPSTFVACVAAASYAIEVPTYGLAGLAESIAIVTKPIYLRAPEDEPEPQLDEHLGFSADEPAAPPLE